MSLSKREKRLLITALIIILSAVFLKYLFLPRYDEYQDAVLQIESLEKQLQESQMIIRDREKYTQMLEEVETELNSIEKKFYQNSVDRARLELLNYFDTSLRTAGIEVESKDLQVSNRREDGITVYTYQAVLKAQVVELGAFLQKIANSNKYLKVKLLEIKGDDRNCKLNIFIRVEAYSKANNE